jgi:putative tryptophan/tyrosine transport system substrate-binding protein
MRRREFIRLIGGAAATWPPAARAQQAMPAKPMPLVGVINPRAWSTSGVAAFRQGLRETGYIEGQNVLIEFKVAETATIWLRQWQRIWSAVE